MKVVFIGAGNVASHLSVALSQKGFDVVQVFSRTEFSAKSLAEKVEANYTTDIVQLDRSADIYIYSVSDRVLPELVPLVNAPDALHLHTSGSLSMDVFKGYAVHYGVFYPLQTFSKNRAVDFSSIPLFLEGNNQLTENRIKDIALKLSDSIYFADSEKRRKLHLSAVFACNFVNHMYELGAELVADTGFPLEVLFPLIEETAWKIKELSPYDAQTGPAVRNDRNVIDRHLAMLEHKRKLAAMYELICGDIYAVHKK